jgi:hypothetical protein
MNTNEFQELKHFVNHKGIGLIPATSESREWLELLKPNQTVNFKVIEARDIALHKAYFGMLAFIYDRLRPDFKERISKPNFYIFLKEIGKEYKVLHTFKDGVEFKEYNSISFGKMNNTKFKEYFNNQLSIIYEDLLFPLEQYYLMDEINKEWQAVLNKLI